MLGFPKYILCTGGPMVFWKGTSTQEIKARKLWENLTTFSSITLDKDTIEQWEAAQCVWLDYYSYAKLAKKWQKQYQNNYTHAHTSPHCQKQLATALDSANKLTLLHTHHGNANAAREIFLQTAQLLLPDLGWLWDIKKSLDAINFIEIKRKLTQIKIDMDRGNTSGSGIGEPLLESERNPHADALLLLNQGILQCTECGQMNPQWDIIEYCDNLYEYQRGKSAKCCAYPG